MNSITKTLGMITSGLFFLGGLAYFGMNLTMLNYANGFMRGMKEVENPTDPWKDAGITIINNRENDSRRFRPGYKELARFNDIKADRQVYFTAYVPVRDLMKPGETTPSKSMLKVFAQTRAIYYAQQECERLQESLATECEVERATGDEDDGMVRVSGVLRFVQKASFGELSDGATYTYQYADNTLDLPSNEISAQQGETQRKRIYKQIARECADIRRREGNCAITSVMASMSKSYSNEFYYMRASARYSFLEKQANEVASVN